MRYELKSIPVWPVAKVAFFVHLVFGFAIGVLLAVFAVPFLSVLVSFAPIDTSVLDFAADSIAPMMIILPFLSALWSAFFLTLFMALFALVYNLVARLVGGLEFGLEPVETHPPISVEVQPAASRPSEVPLEPSPAGDGDRPQPPPPVTRKPPMPPPPAESQAPSPGFAPGDKPGQNEGNSSVT